MPLDAPVTIAARSAICIPPFARKIQTPGRTPIAAAATARGAFHISLVASARRSAIGRARAALERVDGPVAQLVRAADS